MLVKKRLYDSWKLFLTHWKHHPLMYILDILFIVLTIASFMTLQLKIVDNVSMLSEIVMEEIETITMGSPFTEEISVDIMSRIIAERPEISTLLNQVIFTFLGMIFLLYIIFCVFQGINWALSARLIRKIKKPFSFFLRFIGINSFWLILFLIILYVWFNITFFNMKSLIPVVNTALLNIITLILLIIVSYFAILSYVLIEHHPLRKLIKETFRHGAEYVVDLMIMFFVMLSLIVVSFLIVWIVYPISALLTLAAIIVVFVPVLTLLRFFAIVTINDIIKK